MKNIYIVVFICLTKISNLNAQIIEDIGGITYTIYENGEVKNSTELNNRSFSFSSIDAWIPIPELKIGKTSVFSNLNYRYLAIEYANDQALFSYRPNSLQEIKSTIFIDHSINKDWSIFGMVIPSLASDFRGEISSNDFLIQGGFAVMKKLKSKSNLKVGVGVFASYVFGEITYLPSLVMDYKSANGKWIAQAYWPKFNVLRNLKSNWQVGVAASIEGTQYNVKNFIAPSGSEVDYAEYSIIQTGIQINKKLYKSIWMQLQTGYAYNNKYILFDKNSNKIENGDYSLENLFYGKILVTYRL